MPHPHRLLVLTAALGFLLGRAPAFAEDAGQEAMDLTQIPFEQLLQTEVVSAAKLARQISDAPSAVSIATRQDIKAYGYRTLAEILNSMRGVYITNDFYKYAYVGGRGYGTPGDYAGRLLLMIDGYKATDNFYDSGFFANEGFLDVELIERVEYIPGPGAGIHGNGAFLGTINVITRKGRDIGGTRAAVEYGSHQWRKARITYGDALQNGADILFSGSVYSNDGRDYDFPAMGIQDQNGQDEERNHRFFFKGQFQGWSLEAGAARRHFQVPGLPYFGIAGYPIHNRDDSAFFSLKKDSEFTADIRNSTQLYYGQYLFDADYGRGDFFVSNAGRWWGVETRFVSTALDRHRLMWGGEYRDDYQQDYTDNFGTPPVRESLQTFSLFAQDEYTLNERWKFNLGARYDHTSESNHRFSPVAAAIYTPVPGTTLKLSQGMAERTFPRSDIVFAAAPRNSERIVTTELALEQKLWRNARLIASLYHYHNLHRLPDAAGHTDLTTDGMELEYEQAWDNGIRLRTSYAQQYSRDEAEWLTNSPKNNFKLNLTAPLRGESLRAGLEVQCLSQRRKFDPSTETVPGYCLANLTFTSSQLLPGLNATLSIRNLLDREYQDVYTSFADPDSEYPSDGRNYWLQLEYRFR
jgi:iron complex outermembrane receptor protein